MLVVSPDQQQTNITSNNVVLLSKSNIDTARTMEGGIEFLT